MNETENRPSESSEANDLRTQFGAMRRQIGLVLLALFLISGTMTAFLFLQARWLGKELAQVRPQAKRAMDAAISEQPVITAFMAKLAEYGKTHPSFQPVVDKYGLGNTNPAALNTAAQPDAAPPQ